MSKVLSVFILGIVLSATGAFAQEKTVSSDNLDKIRASFKKDGYTKAMQNALSANDIKKIAFNRNNVNTIDHNFKYRVDVSGITNQKSSGRCWMFTSMNVLRPKVMDRYSLDNYQFSQNYLYFWDIFEKSNLFLANIIETADLPMDDRKVNWYFRDPAGDGGVWNNFVNLVKKYGLVPKEVMTETHSSENTSWMVRLVKRKLREDGLILREMKANGEKTKAIDARKVEMLSEIYRMLALNLGEPPVKFEYRMKNNAGELSAYKTYTPQEYRDIVLEGVNLDDYVMLMNDPTRPYFKHYEIENYRNIEEGENWHYVNLPNEDLKRFAMASIKGNEAMYASCDVGKQLDNDHGILAVDNYDFESVYNVKFGMDKAGRIRSGESGSSHGMALIAVDVDENEKPVMWQFENSWGDTKGHNGYLTFTDEWFSEYMFRLVVHKKFLDKKVVDIYEEKAEMLPPWDPMF
ncbi:biotin transporter BioY [Puteibacter caeruleilacunae]|nr:biotin transporter BioY [Puteibacter caeruleilacunae]